MYLQPLCVRLCFCRLQHSDLRLGQPQRSSTQSSVSLKRKQIHTQTYAVCLRTMPLFLHDVRKAVVKKELKYIKWSEGKHYQVFEVRVKKNHFMSMGNLTISFSCNQSSFFKTFTVIFFPLIATKYDHIVWLFLCTIGSIVNAVVYHYFAWIKLATCAFEINRIWGNRDVPYWTDSNSTL